MIRPQPYIDWWYVLLGFIAVVGSILVLVFIFFNEQELKDTKLRCEDAGGVYILTRGPDICIDEKVIINY